MKRITSTSFLRKGFSFLCIVVGLGFVAHAQMDVSLLEESVVEFEAKDERETITGTIGITNMDFMLDVDNVERSSLRIVVDPTTFSSGNGIRDTNARRTVFETRQFPEIIFDLQTVNSSAATLADGGTVDLTLQGELAMHGVTNPLEIPASLTRLGNKVTAQGQFEVSLTSFEMSRPSFLVWTIDDIVIIRFTISGSF